MATSPAHLPVQYITGEDGQRIGVLLSLEDFDKLRQQSPTDEDLLTELSIPELQALADGMLAPEHQGRLNRLLERNQRKALSSPEAEELDRLLEQIDVLSILKARAKLTLQSQDVDVATRSKP